MKKFKLYNLALIVALASVFTACSDDDDATMERGVKPVISVVQTDFSVTEGDIVTINLTSDMAFSKDMGLKLELVGGSGSFRDYVCSGDETEVDDGYGIIGHKLSFPAYSTTASFDITPVLDYLVEGTETLVFRLYGMDNASGIVAESSETITITVANGTSDDVHVVVDWSQTYANAHGNLLLGEYLDADGDPHAFCDYDFDLEIYDGSFSIYDTSYGSCPEQVIISATDAPDDTYFIVPSFWTNVGPTAPAERINFKVKVTVAKPGIWVDEVNIDNVWNSTAGGAEEGFADAYILSHVLTKTGNTYVLENENGDIVASGRSSNVINRIPKKASK